MTILTPTNLSLSVCPHCGVDSPNLSYVNATSNSDYLGRIIIWGFYKCNRCAGVVIATSDSGWNGTVTKSYPEIRNRLSDDIPARPREYLIQAIASRNAPAGAIMLASNAVGAMLQIKEFDSGTLNQRISSASNAHLITEEMAIWAHEVRLVANDERHPELDSDLPTTADADTAIDFALALAEFLFVLPARVKRGRVPQ